MHWTELALKKAGCSSREEFQRKYQLPQRTQWDLPTCRALWPWIPGYVWHRAAMGETVQQAARRYGASVREILAANRDLSNQALRMGQAMQIPLPCRVVSWELPFGSQLQDVFLDGLQARCPDLQASPLARTAGGRTVWSLRLGSGRRKLLLTAGHHANEYITSILLWRLLEDYCRAILEDGCLFGFSARMLFQKTCLHVVPLVNPDGVDLVTGEIEPGEPEYERARVLADVQPETPFPGGWKANLQGVDLNLNYPARWELAQLQKPKKPGPRDYPGSYPLSQPETAALAAYTKKLSPDAVAAWHTQGGEIYAAAPDGWIPDADLAGKLARGSGYTLAQVPPESANAGYRDWVLQELGRPAFTIEAGQGENPLPLSDMEQLYQENLPIFALLLNG